MFLDAHADFYPPEESPTGEASDSELYLAFGFGPALIADLDGARPLVPSWAAAVIGQRDLAEQQDTGVRLRATEALVLPLAEVRAAGPEETARLALAHLEGVEGFLVHIDCDVLDDALMPAVDYRLPGGLTRAEFATLVGTLLSAGGAVALDVTIYNPRLDPDGSAGRTLLNALTDAFAYTTP